MSDIFRSALVNYSARQMYDLVNDVAQYQEFLPGCILSQVLEQSDTSMLALMELKKGPVKQTITTLNTLVPGQSIQMDLQEGPFRFLHGIWNFHELAEDGSKVELELSFEFNNRLTAAAFGSIFNELTSKLVNSFVVRAEVVYGQ